ncbi:hypothetical protein MMC26_001499 [Xylographa opegraphella]|nr:hypothetical protein [Xylographa opegraphella]
MPPPHFERLALRWLLRAALLGTVAVAVWNTLARSSQPSQPSRADRGNALVVVSQRGDDVSWLEGVLPGWERNVYVVDGEALREGARLRIPRNKGREGMAYLRWVDGLLGLSFPITFNGGVRGKHAPTDGRRLISRSFIIDHYDRLPNVTIFLHSARYQWHNDDPDYGTPSSPILPLRPSCEPAHSLTTTPHTDGVPILQNLRLAHVHAQGYANLRCGWTLGCPAEIQPARHAAPSPPPTSADTDTDAQRTEHYYAEAFRALFPEYPVPETVGVGCCAQFAVTRATLLARPRADYERYRAWLLATPLPDAVSGRVLEYSWHVMFGKAPVHCPDAGACYCHSWGLCALECSRAECMGRYVLPPYSTLPEGWPRVGWGGEERGGGRGDGGG